MRALIVTNMYPSPQHPALGSFVADQVQALQRTGAVELEVFAFEPGGYLKAAAALASKRRVAGRYDIVHAHFGLTQWPAFAVRAARRVVTLHGTDLAHPRSRPITLAGLRANDLIAAVSAPLLRQIPSWAAPERKRAVLPAGVDLHRFRPIPRVEARAQLGLDPAASHLLFPADPARPEKRFDRARELAQSTKLLTLGNVEPARVPLYVNAANAVLVTSEREGFGLAALEALACDVPVLSTPVGVAPEALRDVAGALCADYDPRTWQAALRPYLRDPDPRIQGRAAAERYSTDAMAARVIEAWDRLLAS